MNVRDPLAAARGLGSAKSGFGHWWAQRLSALVLALFTPFVVYCLAKYGLGDYALLKAQFANPLWSAASVLYVLALFWHARLGLQVVIEDYIHGEGAKVMMLFLNAAFAYGIGLITVFAILKISFGA